MGEQEHGKQRHADNTGDKVLRDGMQCILFPSMLFRGNESRHYEKKDAENDLKECSLRLFTFLREGDMLNFWLDEVLHIRVYMLSTKQIFLARPGIFVVSDRISRVHFLRVSTFFTL